MPDPSAKAAASFPRPLSVNAATSAARPPFAPADLAHIAARLQSSGSGGKTAQTLTTAWTVTDRMKLNQTGWGVIFPTSPDPATEARYQQIKLLLQPLLDLRQKQVNDKRTPPRLFQIFDGPGSGVSPGQTAESWTFSRGVPLNAPVDPYKGGVPYYLLLIGSPQDISFDFQARMRVQWSVGRLAFDDLADYGRYAQAVAAYENPANPPAQRRSAAVWMTRNPDDDATLLLSSTLADDFTDPDSTLGAPAFNVDTFIAEQATKQQLADILRGDIPHGPPAVIFTGSHGTEYPLTDPDTQRQRQGALITQEWVPGAPVGPANQFAADDIPADATLQGAFAFLFACFSGGCPQLDSYAFSPDGTPRQLAPQAMISRLPQALLARGVLAVFAHIDAAYSYALVDTSDTPQTQVIRGPLEMLMQGLRAGLAAETFTSLWTSLGIAMHDAPLPVAAGATPTPDQAAFANRAVAYDDARNYIVLGDPATSLRVADLKP